MPQYRQRCCCGNEEPCNETEARFVEIEPQMFPDKFMAHEGEYGVGDAGRSFWVRYFGTCPGENGKDVIIEQETGIITGQDEDGNDEYEVRQILQGDLNTKFMTDLGPGGPAQDIPPGTPGMTRPGDNKTRPYTFYLGSAGYGGQMDSLSLNTRERSFEMFHRNCFKLKETFSPDGDRPYLTETEWLAREDFRIVFLSTATNPDLVSEPEDVAQYGVHIFTDDVPFQELDCVPNKYSPALHCIPHEVVGGFRYSLLPDTPEQEIFVLYDYKDYYFEEVGMNINQGSAGTEPVERVDFPCDITYTAEEGGTFPAVQAIATGYLVPEATLPFDLTRRFACPADSWIITPGALEQNFPYASNGDTCENNALDPYPAFCRSEGLCHGDKDIIQPEAHGAIGNTNCVRRGYRNVFEEHPTRNRLFVQGVFKDEVFGQSSSYSVQISAPGSDDFEGATYVTFTGGAADQIELYEANGVELGSVFFGSDGTDPNPPTSFSESPETIYYVNFSDPFGPPYNCDCVAPNVTFLNLGRVDAFGLNFAEYVDGAWIKKTPGYTDPGGGPEGLGAPTFQILPEGDSGENNGADRSVGDPQFIFA